MSIAFVSTNGCIEGELNSKRIERFLQIHGWNLTQRPEDANVVIFYACGLTEFKENHSLELIREMQSRKKPDTTMIIWGCLPKINPSALRQVYDGPLLGALDIDYFERFVPRVTMPLSSISQGAMADEISTRAPLTHHGCDRIDPVTKGLLSFMDMKKGIRSRLRGGSKVYSLSISTGCSGHCTYCSERPVFGSVRSRPIEDIVTDFKQGLAMGANTFSLVGTDLGSYGHDLGYTLPQLLAALHRVETSADYRLILNQIEPQHFIHHLSEMDPIFALGKIERVMTPVQSGSDRVLRRMGRRYTSAEWRDLVLTINTAYPNIQVSTQFMVGFPGETDDDFHATLKLLDPPLRLDNLYIFKFSPRPGIPAAAFKDHVDAETKDMRAKAILKKFARRWTMNSLSRSS